jgi:hypothetical protein
MADDQPILPTLENALLFLAGSCDGATSIDGQGFNRNDAGFGKAMAAKVLDGQRLTPQEYKDVYKMLKNYNNNQLIPAGMDIRLIPKDPTELKTDQKEVAKKAPLPRKLLQPLVRSLCTGVPYKPMWTMQRRLGKFMVEKRRQE